MNCSVWWWNPTALNTVWSYSFSLWIESDLILFIPVFPLPLKQHSQKHPCLRNIAECMDWMTECTTCGLTWGYKSRPSNKTQQLNVGISVTTAWYLWTLLSASRLKRISFLKKDDDNVIWRSQRTLQEGKAFCDFATYNIKHESYADVNYISVERYGPKHIFWYFQAKWWYIICLIF